MAVTQIDPAAGVLTGAIANAFDALAQRMKFREANENKITQDLGRLQNTAAAYRAAVKAGQGDVFLEGIKVRPEFGDVLLSSQATLGEISEVKQIDKDLPGRAIDAAGIEADLTVAEGQEILGSNVIPEEVRARQTRATVEADTAQGTIDRQLVGRELDNAVLQSITTGQQLSEEIRLNIPEERARTEASALDAAQEENQFTESLFRIRNEDGTARFTVSAENLVAQAQAVDAGLDIEYAQGFKDYIDDLDLTDPVQQRVYNEILTGFNNPSYLAHLGVHEQIDLQASLRSLSAGATSHEAMFDATLRMGNEIQAAVKALNEAEGRAAVEQATKHLDNLRLLGAKLQVEGLLYPMDLTGAEPRGGKYEFFFDDVVSDNVPPFLEIAGQRLEEAFLEGHKTPEEILQEAIAATKEANLTLREQEEFQAKFPIVLEIARRTTDDYLNFLSGGGPGSRAARSANRFTTTAEMQELISRASAGFANLSDVR